MNSISKNYFDISIINNHFSIIETPSRTHKSALATLKKIEEVLKLNLKYSPNRQDENSKLSDNKLLKIFQEQSDEILNQFKQKPLTLNLLTKKGIIYEDPFNILHTRINNLISPPAVLELPEELIQNILRYLKISDLGTFALLNRHGKMHADIIMVTYALHFGYQERNSEAVTYLKNLATEIDDLFKQKRLHEKYFFFEKDKKKCALETTLKKFKSLTPDDIFDLFASQEVYPRYFTEKTYPKFFTNVIYFLNVKKTGNPSVQGSIETSKKGSKALILASRLGKIDLVQLLLRYGADPNISSYHGSYSLHWAAQAGFADAVLLLIKAGANIHALNRAGATALCFACGFGNISLFKPNPSVTQILLQHGANPNINTNGNSPLHRAVEAGLIDIASLLIKAGANINAQNLDRTTPLGIACSCKYRSLFKPNLDLITLLLHHGADPNIPTSNTSYPLHWAAQQGCFEMISLLIQAGANVNSINNTGATPLCFACGYGEPFYFKPNRKGIALLLQHGANPNIATIHGNYPLHFAKENRLDDIVFLLLKAGAYETS